MAPINGRENVWVPRNFLWDSERDLLVRAHSLGWGIVLYSLEERGESSVVEMGLPDYRGTYVCSWHGLCGVAMTQPSDARRSKWRKPTIWDIFILIFSLPIWIIAAAAEYYCNEKHIERRRVPRAGGKE